MKQEKLIKVMYCKYWKPYKLRENLSFEKPNYSERIEK